MLNINPFFINNKNLIKPQKNNSLPINNADKNFTASAELNNIQPNYNIKTPIAYQKTGEINFPYDLKAHCYKLANGQKVIIVPKVGETVLKTYVNTGSMNEPDNVRGISHYIEHNLFNGSDGLEEGQFFKEVDKMGASTNASTGFAETNYYISSNLLGENDLENKIKIHASMLETPHFALEKLEKEKGIVNSEINMILSDPENIAVNKTIKNLYNINSTSTDLIGGTTDNITNLSREDVVNYYNNNYYPANMVTVITGDVKPDDTIKLISKYFTSKKQPSQKRYIEPLVPIQNPKREDIISDKATATTVIVGFNGPSGNDIKDRILTKALGKILTSASTSRMYKSLKPLNTFTWMNTEKISTNPSDGVAILFSTDCVDENSEKVLKVIYNEIAKISANPPSDDELQIIKKKMIDQFNQSFEYSSAVNIRIGTAILANNEDYINNYENIVKSITPDDISRVAKKYLDLNKAAVTVVHSDKVTPDRVQKNYNEAKNISFTGKAKHKEALNLSNVKMYNFPNNFKVVTNDTKTNNVYTDITFQVEDNIKTKPSAASLLELILNEGSAFRNQEEYDFETAKNGVTKVFNVSERSVSVRINSGADDFEKGLQLAKETIYNPRFTQETFEYVKKLVRDTLLTAEKSAYDKLDVELYKGLPDGVSKEEFLEDLKTITLDDVKALYQDLMNNAKADVVSSAPFNKKPELNNILFKEIFTLPKVKEYSENILLNVYQPVETAKVLTDTNNSNQAEIIMAYKYKANNNIKDIITLKLLNKIFGGGPSSRLFSDLREQEKLAYSVRSKFDTTEDIGTIKLSIGTTTENKETGEISYDNVQKSIEGFKRHIAKIKSEKVTDEEFSNAKLSLKNDILSSNEGTAGKTSSLASGLSSPYGLARENQCLEMIDQITIDDIYNAANYIFAGKPTYSILATENTLKANKEYLDSLVD